MKHKNRVNIYSFYCFLNLKKKENLKKKLEELTSNKILKGTILLADEGINGSIAGSRMDLDLIIKFLKKSLNIKSLNLKINFSDFIPFTKMRIRLKNEIVTLGKGDVSINKNTAKIISPKDWDSLIVDNEIFVLDVRNDFEVAIGSFHNAINLKTLSFRDFSSQFKKLRINKNSKIAMFCTGGIRCEKASAYLKTKGYNDISQLKGGILNYLDYKKISNEKSLWNGECFVFDKRVTINNNLSPGTYEQCHGCRRPLTKFEVKSKNYIKGVHCPHCVNKRSKDQKQSSYVRQKQIDNSEKKAENHPFKKIYL